MKLFARLSRVGISASTAETGLSQFAVRLPNALDLLGLQTKDIIGKSLEQQIDIALNAYRKRFAELAPEDAKNYELAVRKKLQERASGVFFKLNVSSEKEAADREVINSRFGAVAAGNDPLAANNARLAARPASQFEILSSGLETAQLQFGQGFQRDR